MGRRKHRGSTKHKGVVLVSRPMPGGTGIRWLGRYVDPDTGKRREVTVPDRCTTQEQRAAWAKGLADKTRERADDVQRGAPLKTGKSLKAILEHFFAVREPCLRERTVAAYRVAAAELLAFADELPPKQRIETGDDLKPATLAAFRAWVLARPKGGEVGADRRSTVTANQRLRSMRTILSELMQHDLVPMLTLDAIKTRLHSEGEETTTPDPLKPSEIPALLKAVLRHDAARFKITRAENRAGGSPGQTPKHEPVAPLLLTLLLTGMRRDEARLLRWDRVDLAHKPSGAIHLRPEDVKTKRARTIDLKVTPAVQQLLTAMKLRAGDAVYVFGERERDDDDKPREPRWTEDDLRVIRKRLRRDYGAPDFNLMRLRETAATYMVNGTVFGYDTVRRAAKNLGHGVLVAERRYWDVVNIEHAETVEAAMGVAELAARIVRAARGEAIDLADLEAATTAVG